jgi:hypothetical protein
VALDAQGSLVTSTNPGGGRLAWRITFPFSGAPAEGAAAFPLPVLACPAANLCVVGGVHDDLVVSTTPTGGPDAWSTVQLPGSAQIQSVACPNSSLCLAADANGNILYSADPTGGRSAWHEDHIAALSHTRPGQPALSCPSENFCAAVDGIDGTVVTTSDPQGGSAAWSSRIVDTQHCPYGCLLQAISCPSQHFCAAFDGLHVLTSMAPATASWTATRLSQGTEFDQPGIFCHSSRLCLAYSMLSAHVSVSTDPTGQETEDRPDRVAVSCQAAAPPVGSVETDTCALSIE